MARKSKKSKHVAPHHAKHGDAHDAMHEHAKRLATFVRTHLATLLLFVIVASLVGVATRMTLVWRQQRTAKAFASLAEAGTAAEFEAVATRYKGTIAGEQAALKHARALLEEGRYDEAAARFAAFSRTNPGSRLAAAARLGEAYTLEAQGLNEQAEQAFSRLAMQATAPDVVQDAFIGAGRCAMAGNRLADAEKWLQRAIDAGADGERRTRAMAALRTVRLARQRAEMPPAPGTAPGAPEVPEADSAAEPAE